LIFNVNHFISYTLSLNLMSFNIFVARMLSFVHCHFERTLDCDGKPKWWKILLDRFIIKNEGVLLITRELECNFTSILDYNQDLKSFLANGLVGLLNLHAYHILDWYGKYIWKKNNRLVLSNYKYFKDVVTNWQFCN